MEEEMEADKGKVEEWEEEEESTTAQQPVSFGRLRTN